MVKRGLLFLIVSLCPFRAASSAESGAISSEAEVAAETNRSPVTLDGQTLFSVRGTSTFPAERRAQGISERIRAAARDKSAQVESLRAADTGQFVTLSAGEHILLRVFDADAQMDKVSRTVQAELYRQRIAEGITNYRQRRTPRVLFRNSLIALAYTLAALLLLGGLGRLFRGLEGIAEHRLKTHLESLEHQSHQIIQAKPVRLAIQGAFRGMRFLGIGIIAFAWLDLTLSCFPWTREISLHLFPILLNPLEKMGNAFLQAVPNLVFLLVLVLVTRYALKLIRLYFSGLERGTITLGNFDQDWAWPTYKIVRLLMIAFVAVIAYPYIPGSGSDAFKGISLFLGVIFSLGSSSVISNLVAGYSMTYRRAFKIGDRVRIGDVLGAVVESGLVVTRIRTPKNEDVVVPNSTILNSNVMNYSVMARQEGVILHTTVGIGYETPWRQVEAMLKLAADRTPGLLKQPPPFVHLKELGDFAVVYEINAYCDDPSKMLRLYTLLHQNILDIFNEYDVQIMTPAYEGDPGTPKVVPKDKWFASPFKNGKDRQPSETKK